MGRPKKLVKEMPVSRSLPRKMFSHETLEKVIAKNQSKKTPQLTDLLKKK